MKIIKKILIAEDELLFVRVMRMEFEKQGYHIENVVDANEAVDKAMAYEPDLILLDVRLKNNTSGVEAAKRMRERNINTPIIFTTGNSYESTRNQIIGISNANILIKPIDFNQLFEMIVKIKTSF